jgi:hypothetical protein
VSDIKQPDIFSGPEPGDVIYAECLPDVTRRVWHQPADGSLQDITRAVDGIEPSEGGFKIGGKKLVGKFSQSVDRWSADVEADAESSDTMLRGRVK